jgi:hypothetical protein
MRIFRPSALRAAAAIWALLAFSTIATSAESCEKQTEFQCINAPDCTLHHRSTTGGDYSCEASANTCEQGFKQKTDTRADCESKAGCIFVPQICYCAPDLLCRCGGGPPSQCQPETVATIDTEQLIFGSDCWIPGEPGAGILPPCDPTVQPPPQAPSVLTDISELTSFAPNLEPSPRWWEFWKSGWGARWE